MQELQDDIILAFKKGDTDAFVAIYHHFYQSIFTFCKYIVPLSEAEDITSETFLRLWKTRDKWDSITNVRAFLYVSARNVCFDYLRFQKTRTSNQKELAYLLENEHDHILYSEIEAEIIKQVKKEIENLPENCKEVFRMYFFEGKKNPEIAEKLSLSDKTVRNLKSLAFKVIKTNIFVKGLQINAMVFLLRVLGVCIVFLYI